MLPGNLLICEIKVVTGRLFHYRFDYVPLNAFGTPLSEEAPRNDITLPVLLYPPFDGRLQLYLPS
jgi:hypothetical protein